MDGKDEMDSTVSGFSMVSINGAEEVSAEVAVDDSCAMLQTSFNNIHQGLRLMLMADERDESYEDSLEAYTKMYELIAEGVSLMKELKSLVKQVQPKKPRAAKTAKKEPTMMESCGAT
jgi:hypothetical protein